MDIIRVRKHELAEIARLLNQSRFCTNLLTVEGDEQRDVLLGRWEVFK